MILSNLELALHIKSVRNLGHFTSGRFLLRFHMYHLSKGAKVFAIPVNAMEMQPSPNENCPEMDDKCYLTKSFSLKMAVNAEINEVCVFKTSLNIITQEYASYSEIPMHLICELIQVDNNRLAIVDQYSALLNGNIVSEVLQIDFYEGAPSQVIGSLHSCAYKYEFRDKENSIEMKAFCNRIGISKAEEILNYLLEDGKISFLRICQLQSEFFNSGEKADSMKYSQKKIILDKAEKQTQIDQEEGVFKKERKKIFDSPTKGCEAKESSRICEIQKILHENAQKIYESWTYLVRNLMKKEGSKYIEKRGKAYVARLKNRIGESIARFKGSKDYDNFHQEEEQRIKMAHQLRNPMEFSSYHDSQEFEVLNEKFFSKTRPIFFEESTEGTVEPASGTVLVIMVHGLGACRFDMEKLRVQLKRYYQNRLIFYVSSANEGRTEDSIALMGQRLSIELDCELSKMPKIPRICMIGHSMGGLIIRTALPRLAKYKEHFHSLITLSSPHIGYSYSTSKLVDLGLWFMNTVKKCDSLQEMTMQDRTTPEECFLYQLARQPGLEWFKKVTFVASKQDLYVPFYSARIQKHAESQTDARQKLSRGMVYCDMIDNILNRIRGKLFRLDVNFCIAQQNIDNLIGRAAHINFISNIEMLRTFALGGEQMIF